MYTIINKPKYKQKVLHRQNMFLNLKPNINYGREREL